MKSKAMLDGLRLGFERNYAGARQTPFDFVRPLLGAALDLMSDEQLDALRRSKPYGEITEGIVGLNR
jgi:hypothetical protein